MTALAVTDYDRALQAEPQLQVLERMVATLCATAPTGEPFCVGCIWECVLKPLVTPLVGWDRGYPPEQSRDPDPAAPSFVIVSVTEALQGLDERPKAKTATEEWMRGTGAWDAVTNRWLAQLDAADPALGHGIPGPRTSTPVEAAS